MEKKEYGQIGCSAVSMPNALFLVFLVLKLTGVIDWNWWWITSPIWIGVILVIVTAIVITILELKIRR